ncbi:MAG: hypothetical protein H7843_04580 [Nitrospirota bacterium]
MNRTINVTYALVIISIIFLIYFSKVVKGYGENQKPGKYLLKEYFSLNGNIIIRHHSGYPDYFSGDIWLYSKNNPSKKALLFSYERDADVLISPDEKWLVINYRAGTTDTDALLYKNAKGLEYEVSELLNDKAWDLFRKTHKQYKIPDFGHSYAEAVRWSSDSKSILLYIYGHDDLSPKTLEPWFCVYDLTTGKMTLDFNRIFNRDTYHPNGKAKGSKLYKVKSGNER